MPTRLTTFSKLLITLAILGGLFLGGRYLMNNTSLGTKIKQSTAAQDSGSNTSTTEGEKAPVDLGPDDPDMIKVQVFTFGGYAGGWYFNEGFDFNSRSRFYTEYGLKVKFVLIDDFDASRQAWKSGKVQVFGNETSAMATEMEGLGSYNPIAAFQVDWSRGADAMVVGRGITSMRDLKGKKVAVTPSTPSQTFLLWLLDAANMNIGDVQVVEVPNAIDAATAFKSGKVDAALVWSPDDEACVREVPGSKVLQSTKSASNIIADVMMVNRDWAEKNRDKLTKLYEGWMRGNAEINCNDINKRKAAKIMADGTGIPEEDAYAGLNNLRLTTHGDNQNYFGKNINYKGVKGEDIYTKMGARYEKLGFCKPTRPSWRQLTAVNVVGNVNLNSKCDLAEGVKTFTPATEAMKTTAAIASKPISINFPSGKYMLDENSKTIIDLQFSDIARSFANSRIRIEGNTDNVGGRTMNQELSRKRAEAVARYLEAQYGMNRNRFVIVGNGPDVPVPGCEDNGDEACKAKNRRTEFQLIPE